MHYNISAALILIAIVILAIALIAAIVAYINLKNGQLVLLNNSSVSYVRSTLIFFIVIDSIMLLVALYAVAKVRTSNIGGWIGFIIGLIIVILVLIFGISAVNKVDPAFPWVVRGLITNMVFIVLSFFLLVVSVFTKPRICAGNSIKKIYQNMRVKAEDCLPCPPPQVTCPPPQQITCPPPQVNCAPPQPINCVPPQPINCNTNPYLGSGGQISSYVQNPYLPQK